MSTLCDRIINSDPENNELKFVKYIIKISFYTIL